MSAKKLTKLQIDSCKPNPEKDIFLWTPVYRGSASGLPRQAAETTWSNTGTAAVKASA
jgi:hypothetical protein